MCFVRHNLRTVYISAQFPVEQVCNPRLHSFLIIIIIIINRWWECRTPPPLWPCLRNHVVVEFFGFIAKGSSGQKLMKAATAINSRIHSKENVMLPVSSREKKWGPPWQRIGWDRWPSKWPAQPHLRQQRRPDVKIFFHKTCRSFTHFNITITEEECLDQS